MTALPATARQPRAEMALVPAAQVEQNAEAHLSSTRRFFDSMDWHAQAGGRISYVRDRLAQSLKKYVGEGQGGSVHRHSL